MKPVCVVSCPIDTFSGYGARSRDFVNALIKVKGEEWDIKIAPQRWGECPWNYLSKDDPLRKRFTSGENTRPDIWIQITVPNEFRPVGHYNIGVSAGIETTVYPGEFLMGTNQMDLNLVSSKHSKNVVTVTQLEKRDKNTKEVVGIVKCEKPIEVLFEGLDLNTYNKKPQNSGLLKDIPEDFCFLYTGHWLPGALGHDRKNTGLMLKTFLETFKGSSKKKPALIMKTNECDYSNLDRDVILNKINKIKDIVGDNLPNIYLLHGEMTDDEMNQLNNDNKVKAFVSFTKGEGYGRPLAEAAITGKPVIVSNWSGHIDFLHPDYNVLIGGELENVHKSSANEFLLKESQWFKVNTTIASKAMKDVVKHYKKYFEKSRKQTQYLKDNFSFDKMCNSLNTLLPTDIKPQPQEVQLELPTLKKVGKSNTPQIELPTLKKV
jgi:glycosyltransferase involved in cell wall biosynthesis|tara:strand:- start:848 stop:2149 length:1302 start_codon:yes stop_codon:yes gene_type:complete